MEDFYDFSKMETLPHPLQAKIDRGELKLKSPYDIPEEEFQEKIKLLDEDAREFILARREERKQEKLLQEISQAEDACGGRIPSEIMQVLEKVKAHLASKKFKEFDSGVL